MKRIISSIILFLIFPICNAWWNPDWKYRAVFDIENRLGVPIHDYQLYLNITWIDGMSYNFNDLRFTYWNETLGKEVKIPYWIEDMLSGEWASIWVRIPYIPVEGLTLYMYFGNPNATTESNFLQVFYWIDKITEFHAVWHMDDGELLLTGDGGTISPKAYTDEPEFVEGEQYYGVNVKGKAIYKYYSRIVEEQPFSVCFWIKFHSLEDGVVWDTGGLARGGSISLKDGNICGAFWFDRCIFKAICYLNVSVEKWYHICFVHHPREGGELFVNGERVGMVDRWITGNPKDETSFGGHWAETCWWGVQDYSGEGRRVNATFDEFYHIYKVLTPDEVKDFYSKRIEFRNDHWVARNFVHPEPFVDLVAIERYTPFIIPLELLIRIFGLSVLVGTITYWFLIRRK